MSNLFKSLKPKMHVSKNGFDLSRKIVYSSKAGEIHCPVQIETVPADHIEIDLQSISRTMTMNTAAFIRGSFKYDFYFVPYTQIWSNFNQFITQRSDKSSINQKQHNFCPVVDISDMLQFIWDALQYDVPEDAEQPEIYFDIFGHNIGYGALKLLDELGYGNFRYLRNLNASQLQDLLGSFGGKYVNVFRLAAYQSVWYHYYRNKYFDTDDQYPGSSTSQGMRNYIEYYNFDDLTCDTFGSSVISDGDRRLSGLLTMRHRQWKKDLFTSAMPSQQFGAVSSVDINGSILNDKVRNGIFSTSSSVSVANTAQNGALGISADGRTWTIPSGFDVLSLRRAEVLQNWKQATLRAGNMTDDSFEAHYGVTPYYENDHMPLHLGSFSMALNVQPVESTAAGAAGDVNNKVGDLAARGVAVNSDGDKISFDCRDFGVIICMASYLPEIEYSSLMIDKANTLYEQFDFFTKEFENIGLEAVNRSSYDFTSNSGSFDSILGYAPRYYMYKQAVSKVLGNFASFPVIRLDPSDSTLDITTPSILVGNMSSWVAPRTEQYAEMQDATTVAGRALNTFYVPYDIYDSVMAISANETSDTDYFVNNVYFDIKAIRPMSVLGLPQF